jgi:hypothetical protein
MNVVANENFKNWVCFAYGGVSLISISAAFCLIKFMAELNIILIGFFVIVLVSILPINAICIQLAIQLSLNSKATINLLSKSDSKGRKREMIDSMFWKSCTPIEIWAGSFFSLASPDFLLQIYGTVIFESVINLLLATRGF